MSESAFEADERKRRQKESEQTLRALIGVQDEHGRQLHGHERTLAANELREEQHAAAPKEEPPRPVAQNLHERMKEVAAAPKPEGQRLAPAQAEQRHDKLSVAINQPHKADVRGNSIALTIQVPPAAQSVAIASIITPWQPIPGVTANTVRVEPFAQLLGMDLAAYSVTNRTNDFVLTQTNYLLYLEMSYTLGLLSSVTLKKGPVWSGYPAIFSTTGAGVFGDPYIPDKARLIIAYAKLASDSGSPAGCMNVTDGSDTLKVIRCVFDSLGLALITCSGVTFAYPYTIGRHE